MADYLTANARPQMPRMISSHETLSAQFAFVRPPPPTRTVFDRLISDSDIRRKHSTLKEGKPKPPPPRPVNKEKIEEKLMVKYEAQQTRLMHLKAVRESEAMSIMQQIPAINQLSRELAMKHREREQAYCNPLVNFRPAQSAPAPLHQPQPPKNCKRPPPQKIVVKLDEDDSPEENLTPAMSAQQSPLESVIEADYEDEETPRLSRATYVQRAKIEQMKHHFKSRDSLMEPEAQMDFISQAPSPDSALKERGNESARQHSAADNSKPSRRVLSYEDSLVYKKMIEERRRIMESRPGKPLLPRGAFSRVV